MRNKDKPIFSLIGMGLVILTLAVHFSYRFAEARSNDVGLGMMLSLANALFLVFTLLWSVLGILEFRILLKSYQKTKKEMNQAIHKRNLTISISYLIMILIQFLYLICNWDEVNV